MQEIRLDKKATDYLKDAIGGGGSQMYRHQLEIQGVISEGIFWYQATIVSSYSSNYNFQTFATEWLPDGGVPRPYVIGNGYVKKKIDDVFHFYPISRAEIGKDNDSGKYKFTVYYIANEVEESGSTVGPLFYDSKHNA